MTIYHVVPKVKMMGYDPDWPAAVFSTYDKAEAYSEKLKKSHYDPDLVSVGIFELEVDEEVA